LCLDSDNPRWLVEYAEWDRADLSSRGVSLLDVCALADGIRQAAPADLGADERAPPNARWTRDRHLEAATAVSRRPPQAHALWKWMYRGV